MFVSDLTISDALALKSLKGLLLLDPCAERRIIYRQLYVEHLRLSPHYGLLEERYNTIGVDIA